MCYQRTGDLKEATNIHTEILKLTPGEPLSTSALAEISLLAGNLDQAEDLAAQLQQRAEPQYQILGRMIRAVVAGLRNRHDEAAKELHWVGQFLISSGSIPVRVWDYYDMEPLMPKAGSNAKAFGLLLDALMGKIALAETPVQLVQLAPDLRTKLESATLAVLVVSPSS